MLVYVGSRGTLIKSELLFESCPNCGKSNCLQINIYQRYIHFFWIPIIPDNKTGAMVCTNCGRVFRIAEMPIAFFEILEDLKKKSRAPIWNFTGIFLVLIAIVAVFISGRQNDKKINEYILSPKANDVYKIKLKDDAYTLYKVKKVERDTVYFFANKFQTDQESGLSDLASKEYETSETYGVSKKKLVEMDKDSKIIDIERN